MPAYLIGFDLIENFIDDESFNLFGFENENPDYPMGLWVDEFSLVNLCNEIKEIHFSKCIQNLPVFFGLDNFSNKERYNSALTAKCVARYDGTKIKGVSILKDYWFDDFCFDLKRCFRFSLGNDREYLWRVVGHTGDISQLCGYWENEVFSLWLESLGEI